MGKKRSISVRRLAERLIEEYPDKFTDDFEENKKRISEIVDFPYKTVRNEVAGYIHRIIKRKRITPFPRAPTLSVRPDRPQRRRGRRF